jgi:hypothetical protein
LKERRLRRTNLRRRREYAFCVSRGDFRHDLASMTSRIGSTDRKWRSRFGATAEFASCTGARARVLVDRYFQSPKIASERSEGGGGWGGAKTAARGSGRSILPRAERRETRRTRDPSRPDSPFFLLLFSLPFKLAGAQITRRRDVPWQKFLQQRIKRSGAMVRGGGGLRREGNKERGGREREREKGRAFGIARRPRAMNEKNSIPPR